VSLGAFLTLLSMGLDPVIGAIVSWEPSGGIVNPNLEPVFVHRTNRFVSYMKQTEQNKTFGDQIPDATIMSAISLGISYGTTLSAEYRNFVTPPCRSGICNFGTYQSLGVEHHCADISTKILKTGQAFYLPKGSGDFGLVQDFPIPLKGGASNSTVTFRYPDPTWFPDADKIGPLIANFFTIAYPWSDESPIAFECVLSWTVHTYSSDTYSSSRSGSWNETVISSWTNTSAAARTTYRQTNGIYIEPPECWVNGTLRQDHGQALDPVDRLPECINHVEQLSHYALQNWFANKAYGITGEYSSGQESRFTNVWAAYLWHLLLISSRADIFSDIDAYVFQNLAQMLTDAIRTSTRGYYPDYYYFGSFGQMYEVGRWKANWAIFAVPVGFVFISLLFTILVAFRTRGRIWKTSSMPLILCGLETQDREVLADSADVQDMKDIAARTKVHFQTSLGGKIRLTTI
jgi:hypothetical protein